MLNFLGTFSVLFVFCCLIPSGILKRIFRKTGRTTAFYPVIIAHGLIWGYLFSGLVTIGMVPLWQFVIAVVANCALCAGVTRKGFSDIVSEMQQRLAAVGETVPAQASSERTE